MLQITRFEFTMLSNPFRHFSPARVETDLTPQRAKEIAKNNPISVIAQINQLVDKYKSEPGELHRGLEIYYLATLTNRPIRIVKIANERNEREAVYMVLNIATLSGFIMYDSVSSTLFAYVKELYCIRSTEGVRTDKFSTRTKIGTEVYNFKQLITDKLPIEGAVYKPGKSHKSTFNPTRCGVDTLLKEIKITDALDYELLDLRVVYVNQVYQVYIVNGITGYLKVAYPDNGDIVKHELASVSTTMCYDEYKRFIKPFDLQVVYFDEVSWLKPLQTKRLYVFEASGVLIHQYHRNKMEVLPELNLAVRQTGYGLQDMLAEIAMHVGFNTGAVPKGKTKRVVRFPFVMENGYAFMAYASYDNYGNLGIVLENGVLGDISTKCLAFAIHSAVTPKTILTGFSFTKLFLKDKTQPYPYKVTVTK